MQILVVEDEYHIARQLSLEISSLGDNVVGPFADVGDALHHVSDADAAILDVLLGSETSFPVAKALKTQELPFLFLTAYNPETIPSYYQNYSIYNKPSITRRLLVDLHSQRLYSDSPGNIQKILLHMLPYTRLKLGNDDAAERLVEIVMLDAMKEIEDDAPVQNLRSLLLTNLERKIAACISDFKL